MELTVAAFAVGTVAKVVNLLGVTTSAAGWTDFYPFGERNWQYYLHWTLELVFNVALLVVTYLGWNSLGLPLGLLAVAGGVFVLGFLGAVLAGLDLGSDETTGLEGELRTGGWYRYSRNPQYVAYIAATVGFAVLAATPLAIAMCVPLLALWFVLPFAEEPWLREQYGEAYERYAERVPRFLGIASVRALVGSERASRSD
jgi:protein-S-isoprenylcysteine O-methyltransferase Ste14